MSNNAADAVGQDVCMKDDPLRKQVYNLDRPGQAFAAGTYAGAGKCDSEFTDEQGEPVYIEGKYAAAGVGYARAEWGAFDAEARGPNASAGVTGSSDGGARAFANAGLGSASASAGPVKATVGLSVDTGVGIGPSGVEVKVLGTGISIGRRMGISLFGNSIEFDLF